MSDFIAENAAYYFWLGVVMLVVGFGSGLVGAYFIRRAGLWLDDSIEKLAAAHALNDARNGAPISEEAADAIVRAYRRAEAQS